MNLELKTKIVNGLNNLKYILLVVSLVAIKILFDNAEYQNKNNNDLDNHLTINLIVNDSLGHKVIKVQSLKVGK